MVDDVVKNKLLVSLTSKWYKRIINLEQINAFILMHNIYSNIYYEMMKQI